MQRGIERDVPNKSVSFSSLTVALRWAQRLFTPLAFAVFVYVGWQSWATLSAILAQANGCYIALAVLTLLMVHFVVPVVTLLILKACGVSLAYPFVLAVHIRRLPARYFPGGIWHAVGRMADFYSRGIRTFNLTIFAILENTISLSIAFVLGGGCVWYFRNFTDIWGQSGFFSLIISIVVLLSFPSILGKILLRRNKKKFNILPYVQSISIYIIIWTFMALAFYFYCLSFSSVFTGVSFFEISGVYLLSWAIGFVAVFSPQGIGVFEFLVNNMLNYKENAINVSLLILGFRAVVLLSDILIYSLRIVYKHMIERKY